MGGECREVRHRDQPRMCFGDEAQHGGDRDIGMADAVVEPKSLGLPARSASRTASVPEICERQRSTQTSDTSLMQALLVKQADGLLARARRQGRDPQRLVPGRLGRGKQRCARDQRGCRDSRGCCGFPSAPRRRPAPRSARGQADCRAGSFPCRRTPTTADARTPGRKASARCRRGERRASRTGR